MSKLIVPVAAVAVMVSTSAILEVFIASVLEDPAKVCKPVNVFATLVTGIFAPAKVVAPVPPAVVGNVPVVNALVDVA